MDLPAQSVLMAIRTAEDWSAGSLLGGFALLFVVVLAVVWALYVTGRR